MDVTPLHHGPPTGSRFFGLANLSCTLKCLRLAKTDCMHRFMEFGLRGRKEEQVSHLGASIQMRLIIDDDFRQPATINIIRTIVHPTLAEMLPNDMAAALEVLKSNPRAKPAIPV